MKKIAVVFATVFALVGGSLAFSTPTLAQCDPDQPAVVISGGSVSNATTIDLNADGGVGISDASGGDDNVAFDFDGDGDIDGDDVVAAAGNGGTADAAANGGAIAVGNVNSGGNVGNVIEVGDTVCAPAPAPEPEKKPVYEEKKPVYVEKKPAPAAPAAKPAPAARPVAALPNTGVGVAGDVNVAFVALALVGAVAAAGYSVRARFN